MIDQILECLERKRTRATYSALGEVIGSFRTRTPSGRQYLFEGFEYAVRLPVFLKVLSQFRIFRSVRRQGCQDYKFQNLPNLKGY